MGIHCYYFRLTEKPIKHRVLIIVYAGIKQYSLLYSRIYYVTNEMKQMKRNINSDPLFTENSIRYGTSWCRQPVVQGITEIEKQYLSTVDAFRMFILSLMEDRLKHFVIYNN